MSDPPFYTPNRTTAPRQSLFGEHLWAIRKAGRQLDCELRDHGAWGRVNSKGGVDEAPDSKRGVLLDSVRPNRRRRQPRRRVAKTEIPA